jgi:hypothetical protein
MRTMMTIALGVTMLVVLTNTAEAGRRRRLFQGQGQPHQGQAMAQFNDRHPPLDPREVYPEYYGGIHARQLQNIGIPTGDIGIRGNGITATPW